MFLLSVGCFSAASELHQSVVGVYLCWLLVVCLLLLVVFFVMFLRFCCCCFFVGLAFLCCLFVVLLGQRRSFVGASSEFCLVVCWSFVAVVGCCFVGLMFFWVVFFINCSLIN